MIRRVTYILILLLLGSASVYGSASKAQIMIRENSVVTGDIVTLGDISEIRASTETRDLLSSISLGYAPRIGAVRTIPLRKIKLVIAARGLQSSEYSLSSPRVAYVRREGQQVPKELIRERVEDTLATAFKNNPIEVRITRLDVPDIAEVPFGTVEIETGLEKVRNLFEPFSLVITVRVDSRISTRFSAAVEIEAYAEVLTATSDIPANTKIRPQELIPVRKRLRKPSTEYLFTRAQAIGLKSSKEIRSGDAVTKSSFIADIVVKNGDRVRIIGTSGRMRLVVSGEALASGRIGDRISVKNLQSKKTVQAKIRGEGVVEIFF